MDQPVKRSPVEVLFVCVGNACRSQMAEAVAKHLGQGRIRAWSAGSHPAGWIAPGTQEVLQEKGILLDGHWSKGMDDVPVSQMDIVVGMGCEVSCPVPAGFKGRVIEWSIPDPFGRPLDFYREVRDLVEAEVKALLESLEQRGQEGVGTDEPEV